MGTKLGFAVGLAVGYVLGAKAGRERYDAIRSAVSKVRDVPFIAHPLDEAGHKVSEAVRVQGERVTDKVADAVKERLFGATPHHDDHVHVDVNVPSEDPWSEPAAH